MTRTTRTSADLRDTVVLVTGARGSIGSAATAAFAARGATVVGLDLPDTGGAGPGTDEILACDLTDEAQVRATVEQVVATHGRLDVLVNNAGISAIGSIDDHDLATHRQVLEVNHLGALAVTLAALPHLRSAAGAVVTIGSVAGFAPVVGRPAYVAAKHAVTGLMEALRPELAADGVHVAMVHPTFVTTALATAAGSRDRSTTGTRVSPRQVADAVVEAVTHRRDRVLVGRTARLAWHAHRLAPRTYTRLMTRRLSTRSNTRPSSHPLETPPA
ncbi:SDR family NAD(P)-dependent oxidoreductase [Serinicoccus sp. LYQ131]|uniref:SDR family NAD(P)-dependent oxidoreductase n=1 Tax=Serinicoccus sp. LYQ131 TaxID=3378797 RepID=UPI003852488D